MEGVITTFLGSNLRSGDISLVVDNTHLGVQYSIFPTETLR